MKFSPVLDCRVILKKKTGHVIDWENTEIMYREQNYLKWKFRENVEIKRCK